RIPALSPGGPHGPPRPWPLSACEGGRSGGTRPTMPLPPSPAHGGGPGWGQPDDGSSKRACGAAPIPTFPRKRGKEPELADRGAPSPPAREGWSGAHGPPRPWPPPPPAGEGRVGAARRRKQQARLRRGPHPNLPPQAGEGAGACGSWCPVPAREGGLEWGTRPATPLAPPPLAGEGWGGGNQAAATSPAPSVPAPIPAFPRAGRRRPP